MSDRELTEEQIRTLVRTLASMPESRRYIAIAAARAKVERVIEEADHAVGFTNGMEPDGNRSVVYTQLVKVKDFATAALKELDECQ